MEPFSVGISHGEYEGKRGTAVEAIRVDDAVEPAAYVVAFGKERVEIEAAYVVRLP